MNTHGFSHRISSCTTIFLVIVSTALFAGQNDPLVLSSDATRVACYDKIEFNINLTTQYHNPFDPNEVNLTIELTDPQNYSLSLPAFYYQPYERKTLKNNNRPQTWICPSGPPIWLARFAPSIPGQYQARAILCDLHGKQLSGPVSFECLPSNDPGFLRVCPTNPRSFITSNGKPFFPIGQNLAFIGETQYLTLLRAEGTLAQLARHGANYVRIWSGCDDWALGIEARKSAFGRSWNWNPPFDSLPDRPDHLLIKLSGPAGKSLNLNPSHPIALRPSTRYILSGKVLTQSGARFQVHCSGQSLAQPIQSPPDTWADWQISFQTLPTTYWLDNPSLQLDQPGTAWIDAISLTEAGGGPELLWEASPNRPVLGTYNQPDCFYLDQVIEAARKNNIKIQLTLLTRDLYMKNLSDESSTPYQSAINAARKTLRYAVARWGYATSLAAWEYFNEIDPGKPTTRFYQELARYLDQIDPYRHLRTTSTWSSCPRDWQSPWLDFAQEHYYYRPADYSKYRDEAEAYLQCYDRLHRQTPDRPSFLGEFGLADNQWRLNDELKQSASLADFHHTLWASALSGSSATALYWWWDRVDPLNHYPLYQSLADFTQNIPWNSIHLQSINARVLSPDNSPAGQIIPIGLADNNRAWLWFYHTQSAWCHAVTDKQTPPTLTNYQLSLPTLPPGAYQIQWWNTQSGQPTSSGKFTLPGNNNSTPIPPFNTDIACHIQPALP